MSDSPTENPRRCSHGRALWVAWYLLSLPTLSFLCGGVPGAVLLTLPLAVMLGATLVAVHLLQVTQHPAVVASCCGLGASLTPTLCFAWAFSLPPWPVLLGFWSLACLICITSAVTVAWLYLRLNRWILGRPSSFSLPLRFRRGETLDGIVRVKRVRFSIGSFFLLITRCACCFGIVKLFANGIWLALAAIPFLFGILVLQHVLSRGLDPLSAVVLGTPTLLFWTYCQWTTLAAIGWLGEFWRVYHYQGSIALDLSWWQSDLLYACWFIPLSCFAVLLGGFLLGTLLAIPAQLVYLFLDLEIVLPDGRVMTAESQPSVAGSPDLSQTREITQSGIDDRIPKSPESR